MAQSLEEIKASFTPPTHDNINGVKVELSADEIEATLNTWAENERARQLDEEANGYKRSRHAEYPSILEFIEAYTEKEILSETTKWDAYVEKYNQVRSDYPKP